MEDTEELTTISLVLFDLDNYIKLLTDSYKNSNLIIINNCKRRQEISKVSVRLEYKQCQKLRMRQYIGGYISQPKMKQRYRCIEINNRRQSNIPLEKHVAQSITPICTCRKNISSIHHKISKLPVSSNHINCNQKQLSLRPFFTALQQYSFQTISIRHDINCNLRDKELQLSKISFLTLLSNVLQNKQIRLQSHIKSDFYIFRKYWMNLISSWQQSIKMNLKQTQSYHRANCFQVEYSLHISLHTFKNLCNHNSQKRKEVLSQHTYYYHRLSLRYLRLWRLQCIQKLTAITNLCFEYQRYLSDNNNFFGFSIKKKIKLLHTHSRRKYTLFDKKCIFQYRKTNDNDSQQIIKTDTFSILLFKRRFFRQQLTYLSVKYFLEGKIFILLLQRRCQLKSISQKVVTNRLLLGVKGYWRQWQRMLNKVNSVHLLCHEIYRQRLLRKIFHSLVPPAVYIAKSCASHIHKIQLKSLKYLKKYTFQKMKRFYYVNLFMIKCSDTCNKLSKRNSFYNWWSLVINRHLASTILLSWCYRQTNKVIYLKFTRWKKKKILLQFEVRQQQKRHYLNRSNFKKLHQTIEYWKLAVRYLIYQNLKEKQLKTVYYFRYYNLMKKSLITWTSYISIKKKEMLAVTYNCKVKIKRVWKLWCIWSIKRLTSRRKSYDLIRRMLTRSYVVVNDSMMTNYLHQGSHSFFTADELKFFPPNITGNIVILSTICRAWVAWRRTKYSLHMLSLSPTSPLTIPNDTTPSTKILRIIATSDTTSCNSIISNVDQSRVGGGQHFYSRIKEDRTKLAITNSCIQTVKNKRKSYYYEYKLKKRLLSCWVKFTLYLKRIKASFRLLRSSYNDKLMLKIFRFWFRKCLHCTTRSIFYLPFSMTMKNSNMLL